jgi:hypothetical protein
MEFPSVILVLLDLFFKRSLIKNGTNSSDVILIIESITKTSLDDIFKFLAKNFILLPSYGSSGKYVLKDFKIII